MMNRRTLLAAAGSIPLAAPALGQSPWPNKPVRVIVGFPPGGSLDVMTRLACEQMQSRFGQAFVVETRSGASGNIGAEAIARATPDGYTIGTISMHNLLINPLLIWLHALTRFTGPDWLHQALDVSTTTILGQQTLPVSRIAAGVVGLAVTLRLARRGRPWAAMFCSAVTVLAVFQLLRTSGYAAWTDVSPTQLAGVLLVVSLTVTVVLLLRRQLTGLRAMALASATLVCLIYPHRAILDDPISALLGFSGVAVVLFGLVWRLLTEGEITQHHTDRWPLPARVLLFCASALLGVTVTAFVTLSRGTGYVIDPARLADGGDFLLGTPLLVTAVIGCLAIALAPRRASSDRPGSGGAAQPAGTVSGAVGRPGY